MSFNKTVLFTLFFTFATQLFAHPERVLVLRQKNIVKAEQINRLKTTTLWVLQQQALTRKRIAKTIKIENQRKQEKQKQKEEDRKFALQLQKQEQEEQRQEEQDRNLALQLQRQEQQRQEPRADALQIHLTPQQRTVHNPAPQNIRTVTQSNLETETKVEKLPNGTLLIPEDFACLFCHKTFEGEHQAAHFACHIKHNASNNFFNFLRSKKSENNLKINTHLYHVDCIKKWKNHPAYGIDGIHQCIAGCRACSSKRIIIPIQLKRITKQQNNKSNIPSCCLLCSKNFKKDEELCCAKLHPDCNKNHSVHKTCMDKWRATAFNILAGIIGGDDIKIRRGGCYPIRGASCPYGCLDPQKTWGTRPFISRIYAPAVHRLEKTDKPYEQFTAQQTTAAATEQRLEIKEAARAQARHFNNTTENKVCFACTENSTEKECRWVNIRCNKGHITTYCEDCWNYVERSDDSDLRTCKIRPKNQNCGTNYTQALLDAATWQTNE